MGYLLLIEGNNIKIYNIIDLLALIIRTVKTSTEITFSDYNGYQAMIIHNWYKKVYQ